MAAASQNRIAKLRQMDERQLEGTVKVLAFSPTMDVVALGMESGDVLVYRLNWHRIWTLNPPAEGAVCSAISWRPDGQKFCLGYDNGCVDLYDLITGNKLQSLALPLRVTSLKWLTYKEPEAETKLKYLDVNDPDEIEENPRKRKIEYRNGWEMLVKLPQLSRAYTSVESDKIDRKSCQTFEDKEDVSPSFLVAGSERGHLHIFLNGFLFVGRIDINAILGDIHCIRNIIQMDNLSTISILSTTEASLNEKVVNMVAVSVPTLSTCFQEFVETARYYNILQGALDYIEETIKQITECWEGIAKELDSKLETFATRVPNGTMSADFLDLLVFGIVSPDLERFLIQDLTERGLKRAVSSIDTTYVSIQKLLLKYLSPAIQSICFFLGDMLAHVQANDKFKIIGIEEEKIKECQKAATTFWSKSVELQEVIEEARENFSIFFKWLQMEILKLGNETIPEHLSKMTQKDVAFIADFLASLELDEDDEDEDERGKYTHRHLEKVGQYLRSEPLDHPVRKKNHWNAFLDENPEIKELNFIINTDEKSSLGQTHVKLIDSIQDLLGSLKTDLTEQAQNIGELKVSFDNLSDSDLLCCQDHLESGGVGGAITVRGDLLEMEQTHDESKPQEIFIFHLDFQKETAQHKLKGGWFKFKKPDEIKQPVTLLDGSFYMGESLSLLLNDSPVTKSQRLMFLPMDLTVQYCKDISFNAFAPTHIGSQKQSHSIPSVDIFSTFDETCHRELDNLSSSCFAVSSRKVAGFLFSNNKRLRVYYLDAEEDDDEDEDEEGDEEGQFSELDSSQN